MRLIGIAAAILGVLLMLANGMQPAFWLLIIGGIIAAVCFK